MAPPSSLMRYGGSFVFFSIVVSLGVVASVDDGANEFPFPDHLEENLTLQIHHNGEAKPCGFASLPVEKLWKRLHGDTARVVDIHDGVAVDRYKYQLESLLTSVIADELMESHGTSCQSTDEGAEENHPGFYGYCDMGHRTVIQPDSASLIRTRVGSLPCRFHTRTGQHIASLERLMDLVLNTLRTVSADVCTVPDDGREEQICSAGPIVSLHLYAVPAGRKFMFAPSQIGETFEISHVSSPKMGIIDGAPVQLAINLKVLSLEPRIFEINNFLTAEEAEELVNQAATSGDLKRSRTGAMSKTIFNKRTSESFWATTGALAVEIKERCMKVIGHEYYRSHTDGLQILRYNETKAYTPHFDYLQDRKDDDYDYNAAKKGGNRFATILLYLNDVEEGGETVFPFAKVEEGRDSFSSQTIASPKDVIQELRQSGRLNKVEEGSWEEEMIGECRTRLATKPKRTRAILFYSTFPNGTRDDSSKHGGCPILEGTKWLANLWVWNAARSSYAFAPIKEGQKQKQGSSKAVRVTFQNSGKDDRYQNAKLYYKDKLFADLGPGQKKNFKSFKKHVWTLRSPNGEVLKAWTISGDRDQETFIV